MDVSVDCGIADGGPTSDGPESASEQTSAAVTTLAGDGSRSRKHRTTTTTDTEMDKQSSTTTVAAVDSASFISRMLFLWISPLITLGSKRTLEQSDLLPMGSNDTAEGLCRRLDVIWSKELKTGDPSLLRACCYLVGRAYFIPNTIWCGLSYSLAFAQPFLMAKIIDYFNGDTSRVDAYIYASAFVVVSVIRAMVYHCGTFVGDREIGMHLRVALSSLIHKKVLHINNSALLKLTTGHIVNLVSTDVQRLDELSTWLSSLWWGILIFIATFVVLWWQLGVSCLAGFAVVILNLMFQVFSSRMMKHFRVKVAALTDKRIRFMNEVITGMQLIKMYVWEAPFSKIITQVRKEEHAYVRKRQYLWGLNSVISEIGVHLIIFAMFTTYIYLGNVLTAGKAFFTLSILQVFRSQVLHNQILGFNLASESKVAIERIQKFLLTAEPAQSRKPKPKGIPAQGVDNKLFSVRRLAQPSPRGGVVDDSRTSDRKQCSVRLSNVTASWTESSSNEDKEYKFLLQDISLTVYKGELTMAVGSVGSGKTSLLMAVLGELNITEGYCAADEDIGYAAQLAWVYAGTIRENIVFGRKFDAERYNTVLSACCLDKDLENMPHGDQTLVGEHGVKISGGQKARLGLARAVYQDAAIYLLDDPLSAVDAEVGRHIFEQCICGLLKDKAVLLITHQEQFLSSADKIMVLEHGKSLGIFTYEALLQSGLDLGKRLSKVEDDTDPVRRRAHVNDELTSLLGEAVDEHEVEEDRSIGAVTWRHYWRYLRAGASTLVLIGAGIVFIATPASIITADWWLASWTAANSNVTMETAGCTDPLNCSAANSGQNPLSNDDFVAVWGGLLILSTLLLLFRSIILRQIFVMSSKKLHDLMLGAILKAPMLFFNSNPSGRILNRFAKDINLLDILLPFVFYEFIAWFLMMVGFAAFISYTNPWTLLTVPPMAIAFIVIRRKYTKSSREMKRLEAIARSPVFSQFSSSLQGLTTIRAAGAQDQLQTKFNNLLDAHTRGWLCYLAAIRWLASRLELMGAIYLTATTFAALLVFDFGDVLNLDAGTLGLSITYQISLYGYIQWVVRMSADVEDLMTSSERVITYGKLEPEVQPPLPVQPPDDWPQRGQITGVDMSFTYSPTLPNALKNLNFVIQPGEKIGIVGRTGAGKSSFINALFRLAPTSGKVMIDGVELGNMLLSTMRQKLSIIPQNPVLYSGTLRYNLDPFSRYPNAYLWNALEMVELKRYVSQLNKGLEAEITEHGSNLSVGQRQLICLARALLNRNKILMIDEATANVDSRTDSIIQQTLRTHFKDCTVITIAHRLHTIIDSDRIMVIDSGRIKEFDEPFLLLQNRRGALAEMVQSLGEKEGEQLRQTCQHLWPGTAV
ncbi:ATP-binding cassette sub-family C member 4-like [Sycon ciliatum]|uniref:ATP-binding cassette sub-family C member 4-like n=1 Tax=Sycon ciliatum TaxID=27933 RepID=UPI0031F649A7